MLPKWPILTNKAWLDRRLQKRMTYDQIADEVGGGCHGANVGYWVRKHGLKSLLGRGTPVEPSGYWSGH